MHNNSNRLGFNFYISAFCIFSLIPAAYVWHSPFEILFSIGMAGGVLWDIIRYGRNKTISPVFLFLFTVFILLMGFRSGYNIIGVLELIIRVIPVLMLRPQAVVQLFTAFRDVFSLIMLPSLVVYFLVIFLQVSLPYIIIEPLNEVKAIKEATYCLYPFLIVVHQNVVNIFRFHGLFDEPGVVGTICTILLCAEKFRIKDIKSIIILLAGIFSFSMFFYAIAGIFIFIATKWRTRLVYFFVIGVLIFILWNNSEINNLVFDRFRTDGDFVSEHSRTSDYFHNQFYHHFIYSSDFFVGKGNGSAERMDEGGFSYTHVIYNFGILQFLFFIGLAFSYAFKAIKSYKNIILFVIYFLGCMYQRPFITNTILTVLILTSADMLKYNDVEEKNKLPKSKKM